MNDVAEHAFRRHYADVYRFIRRRVGTRERAEDLAQEVFAAAAARLRDDVTPPLAWLYTVAKRRFADEARRLSRSPRTGMRPAEYPPHVLAALRAALAALPETQRDVVLLKLIRGLSFAEIGSTLGIAPDAAKMRFVRGLRSLRASLEQEGVKP